MELSIKKFVTGPIETNTYVISKDKNALVIDPSSNCSHVLHHIRNEQLGVEAVILTHGHFDHVLGINEILSVFPGIPVYAHPDEWPLLKNPEYNGSVMLGMQFAFTGPLHELCEGTMRIGSFSVQVFHMPGHSPGGVALVMGNNCFSGDSLFAGSIGRTDFPGCDGDALIRNVRDKLLALPENTAVHPGHGGRTTIAREKKYNPFLQ